MGFAVWLICGGGVAAEEVQPRIMAMLRFGFASYKLHSCDLPRNTYTG